MAKRLRFENGAFDPIDAKILAALASDARVSTASLARSVGLSPPSVAERIKRLEENGVIGRYTIAIDPKALGLPIAAWLRVRPVPGQLNKVIDRFVAYGQTTTSIVQSSPVPRRLPPLPNGSKRQAR